MPEHFDAKASAKIIESFAQAEIDDRITEIDPLPKFMESFTNDQLRAIEKQLKFDSYVPDTLPSVDINFTADGEGRSLTIKPSFWDSDAKSTIAVVGF